MDDSEVLKPEILPCLMDIKNSGEPVPLGTQNCRAFPGCNFELNGGLFGKVSWYGGCAERNEARRAETGESPESSLRRALGRRVIDVEPRP
jgi:hypothetical protein